MEEHLRSMGVLLMGGALALGGCSSDGGSTQSAAPQGVSCVADNVCQPACAADPDCGGVKGGGGAAGGVVLAGGAGAVAAGGTGTVAAGGGGAVAAGGAGTAGFPVADGRYEISSGIPGAYYVEVSQQGQKLIHKYGSGDGDTCTYDFETIGVDIPDSTNDCPAWIVYTGGQGSCTQGTMAAIRAGGTNEVRLRLNPTASDYLGVCQNATNETRATKP